MKTHDPANREDHGRPRRESWSLRLLWTATALLIMGVLFDLWAPLEILLWIVVILSGLAAFLLMIPWGAFGQPEETDDDPEDDDRPPVEEVYPS